MVEAFPGAGAALRDRPAAIVEQWLAAYARSPLRMPRPLDPRELTVTASTLIAALGPALLEPGCAPGGAALRETEKTIAFASGSLATPGGGAFDVAALMLALRDVLCAEAATPAERDGLARLFDWLCALALEAYSRGGVDAARLRYHESLENGTPVVLLAPEVPLAFLVGDPDRAVVDAAFARLLLLVVRVGARAVLLDASGLARPSAPDVLEPLGVFARHRKMGKVPLVVSGLGGEDIGKWRDALPVEPEARFIERFDEAVASALAAAGLEIHAAPGRRPG